MSDKFLVDAPKQAPATYSGRRNIATLQSMRKGQANQQKSHKQIEEERRREGLSKSILEPSSSSTPGEGPKALQFMQKMGWKPGEALGRKRSESPPPAKRQRHGSHADEEEDEAPRGGLGSRSRGRVEPLRISLWSGRKGLSARSPSPPPLPSRRDPDGLDPKKLANLGRVTEDFRTRQRREFEEKETERTERKARDQLIKLDEEKGVKVRPVQPHAYFADDKFHPLHVLPSDPLGTLPHPLLKLIYPSQAYSPGRSPSRSPSPIPENTSTRVKIVSDAEKLREKMRREMLSELGGGEEATGDVKFGIPSKDKESPATDAEDEPSQEGFKDLEGVDWPAQVSGTKRVLAMEVSCFSIV